MLQAAPDVGDSVRVATRPAHDPSGIEHIGQQLVVLELLRHRDRLLGELEALGMTSSQTEKACNLADDIQLLARGSELRDRRGGALEVWKCFALVTTLPEDLPVRDLGLRRRRGIDSRPGHERLARALPRLFRAW